MAGLVITNNPQRRMAHRYSWWLLLLCLSACTPSDPPRISFYRAIHAGDLDQIKRHIQAGVDLNQLDGDGQLPLHIAAAQGSQVICALLLTQGAQLEALNRAGYTPLEHAVLAGKVPVAQLLLQRGARLDAQALLQRTIAANVEFRDVYEFLVKHGADVNAPDVTGTTPLIAAIRTRNRLTVKRLIEQGAQVNKSTAPNLTPLAVARQSDDLTIARLLLQHGAEANP